MTGHAASFRACARAVASKVLACASLVAAALVAQALPGKRRRRLVRHRRYANPATEIVSSGGVLRGTINLTEQFIAMPQPGDTNCTQRPSQLVRIFQGYQGLVDPVMPPPNQPPALKPGGAGADAARASLGDVVQLSFINQVNQNNFDQNLDIEKCTAGGAGRRDLSEGRERRGCRTACTHRARRISISTARIPARRAPATSLSDDPPAAARPPGQPDDAGDASSTQSFEQFFDLCARMLQRIR